MPQPDGPKEGHETPAQQAEKAAQEILKGLDKMFTANTGEELETLKACIDSLITDKLQGLDEHTKRTARGKLREFLTRDVHAATLPDILKRNPDKRNVVLTVNEEGQRAEKPASGGGGYGLTGTLNSQETSGQIGIAALITAIGVGGIYLLNKTKENTKKVGGWLKYLFGSALLFTGALFGLKTWTEFQQGKEALRKAFEETKVALESARQRLDQVTDRPMRAVELLQVSHAYERIEDGLRNDGVRGSTMKAQTELNTRIFPRLKGNEALQKMFFDHVHRTFPHSFVSRKDPRLEFTIGFHPTNGFEVKERMIAPDENLLLKETTRGFFEIYPDVVRRMGIVARPSPEMVVELIGRKDIQDIAVGELLEFAAIIPNTSEFSAHRLGKLFPQNIQAQHALLFLASVVKEQIEGKKLLEGRQLLDEQGRKIDDPKKFSLRMFLHEVGQYVRTVQRVKIATARRNVNDPADVRDGLKEAFDSKRSLSIEVQSPTILRSLVTLDRDFTRDRALHFMDFVEKKAESPLSMYNRATWLDSDPSIIADDRVVFDRVILALQREMKDQERYLLRYVGSQIHSQSADVLKRALSKISLADAVQIHMYLAESLSGGSLHPSPLDAQVMGRAQMSLKLTEIASREDPEVAHAMYKVYLP